MNSYDADADHLAVHLAAMVTDPHASAAAGSARTVNAARLGLRWWARQVLVDLGPTRDATQPPRPGLAELGTDPVGTLYTLLAGDPPRLRLRPDADPTAVEAADERWTRLGRLTELVTHSWATADPPSRPTGERAWSVIADVAAVNEAAALLDRQLLERHPSRNQVAWRHAWDVGIAAAHVRRVAQDGPLPRVRPLREAPQRLKPIPVTSLADLPGELTNLTGLVAGAAHLRPRTVASLIGAHTTVLDALATAVTTDPPPALRATRRKLAAALREHGEALSTLRVAVRPLRSAGDEDLRAGMQMPPIVQLLEKASNQAVWKDPQAQQAATDSLLPALAVTPALAKAATAAVQARRWYEPTDPLLPRWRAVTDAHPVTDAAALATAHARKLMGTLSAPVPRSRHRRPHEVLSPYLLYTDRTRPPSPSTPARSL